MNVFLIFKYFLTKIREKIFGPRKFDLGNNIYLTVSILGTPEIFFADKKTGKKLLDIASFLDYKCVFFEFNEKMKWGAHFFIPAMVPEKITIGNIDKNPTHILLFVLHEIGHINNRVDAEISFFTLGKYLSILNEMEKKKEIDTKRNIDALAIAWTTEMTAERNAWAYALRTMRIIEKRLGITLLNKDNRRAIKEEVGRCLTSHSKWFTSYELYHEMGIKKHEEAEQFLRMHIKKLKKIKP